MPAARHDPTLGRYTQPDPLGFVDGPSVYGYAGGSPQIYVDIEGRFVWLPYVIGAIIGGGTDFAYQMWKYDGNVRCVNPWEVLGAAVLGAAFKGPHWWWSSRSGGGGVRLFRDGPSIDWHKFNINNTTVNRLHYHRGPTTSQMRKHRPWQGVVMAISSPWDEFLSTAIVQMERALADSRSVGVDNLVSLFKAAPIEDERLRAYLIDSAFEIDGFPEGFVGLLRFLKKRPSEIELLQFADRPA